MGYMGRGSSPNIDISSDNINSTENGNYHVHHFHYGYRMVYDAKFVAMEIAFTLVIFLIIGLVFLFTYQPKIDDPLKIRKITFLNTQLFMEAGILCAIFGSCLLPKAISSLKNKLFVLLVLSVTTFMTFVGARYTFDKTYTEEKFGQIYDELVEQGEISETNKSKYSVNVKSMTLVSKTEKQAYVEESVFIYKMFKIKSNITICLNVFVIGFVMFLVYKVLRKEAYETRLSNDDKILYDEEENIKF